MSLLQSLLLGILQGITEFLPISSSGHLVLLESIFQLEVQDLKGFDVILHLGTLLAMVIYFWKDIVSVLKSERRIGYILLASVPAAVIGLNFEDWMDATFREPQIVLGLMIVLGCFFLIAEQWPKEKNRTQWTLRNTFVMGVAQAVALLPGISRSGSVMATGLLHGLKREEAARFSFLLGMPAIAGANLITGVHIYQGGVTLPSSEVLLVGFLSSAVVGYLSVAFLMKFLKTHSLRVFSIYLFGVGMVGLIFI